MKRIAISAVLLLILPVFLSASIRTASDTLVVRAYKIVAPEDGKEHLEMHVYDAITDSLKLVDDNGTINLDKFLSGSLENSSLIGTAESGKTGRLIYAFNVEGNTMGDYTISIEMEPFVLMNGDSEISENKVNLYFYTVNDFAYFKGTEGAESMDSAKLKYINNTSGARSNDADNKISASFIVTGLSRPSVDIWTVRGGIGVILDKSEYDIAPNGRYRSVAKVTLTENT